MRWFPPRVSARSVLGNQSDQRPPEMVAAERWLLWRIEAEDLLTQAASVSGRPNRSVVPERAGTILDIARFRQRLRKC